MIWDLQKASVLKRASAFLLDFILLSILAVGFAALVSAITQYDTYVQTDEEITNVYAEQYFGMKWDDFRSLTDEQRKAYQAAYEEFDKALAYILRLKKPEDLLKYADVSEGLENLIVKAVKEVFTVKEIAELVK